MIRLWRSEKCSGTRRQFSPPKRAGSPQSMSMASSQRMIWAHPLRNDAVTSSPIAMVVPTPNPRIERLRPGSPRLTSQEEREVPQTHDGVEEREPERAITERLRDRVRNNQEGGHDREHHESDRALLGLDHAGQPCVAHPGPPQHGEHEHASGDTSPSGI